MKLFLLTLIFLLLNLTSCSHNNEGHHGHGSAHKQHHRFKNPKKWAKIFEKEERKKWQKPEVVLKTVGLKKSSLIADIGSATGYFPVRMAKKSPKGRVWAIDIEPNLVNYLNDRFTKEKINNAYSILGTPDDPLIPEPVDFIFLTNTYHHIYKRVNYFKNLKKKLRKGGRLVVVDFVKGDLPVGPSDKMKLEAAQVIKELKKAGYFLKEKHDILPYQYILVFNVL